MRSPVATENVSSALAQIIRLLSYLPTDIQRQTASSVDATAEGPRRFTRLVPLFMLHNTHVVRYDAVRFGSNYILVSLSETNLKYTNFSPADAT